MRGRFAVAPPPRFGLNNQNIRRFREVIDAEGQQFDADSFDYVFDLEGTPALASNATAIGQIVFDLDSVFEWKALTFAADDFGLSPGNTPLLNIADQVSARSLMNVPLQGITIGALAELPNILPVTRRFMPGTTAQITLISAGASFTKVSLVMHGRKLFTQGMPPDRLPRFRTWIDAQTGLLLAEDLFYYAFNSLLVPTGFSTLALAPDQVNGRIEAESDFEWIETTAVGGGLDPSQIASKFNIKIRDATSGRYLSSAPVPISQLAGGVNQNSNIYMPYVLPQPRIFPAGSQPILEITNNTGATVANFQFVMGGRKIFVQD